MSSVLPCTLVQFCHTVGSHSLKHQAIALISPCYSWALSIHLGGRKRKWPKCRVGWFLAASSSCHGTVIENKMLSRLAKPYWALSIFHCTHSHIFSSRLPMLLLWCPVLHMRNWWSERLFKLHRSHHWYIALIWNPEFKWLYPCL